MEERRAVMCMLEQHARVTVGNRARVELETLEASPAGDFQLLVTPRKRGALSVGVLADDDWMIVDLGERWGWEPDYDDEGIAFVKATIERAARGEAPRHWFGLRRKFPPY